MCDGNRRQPRRGQPAGAASGTAGQASPKAGSKRKLGSTDAPEPPPSPLTCKRRLLGFTFFAAAFMGLLPLHAPSNPESSGDTPEDDPEGTQQERDSTAEEDILPPAAAAVDGAAASSAAYQSAEAEDASVEKGARVQEGALELGQVGQRVGGDVDVDMLPAELPAPLGPRARAAAAAPRQAAPLPKTMKAVRRSELRRQLLLQLQPSGTLFAAATPPRAAVRPGQGSKSRGSRILTLAVDSPKHLERTRFAALAAPAEPADAETPVHAAPPPEQDLPCQRPAETPDADMHEAYACESAADDVDMATALEEEAPAPAAPSAQQAIPPLSLPPTGEEDSCEAAAAPLKDLPGQEAAPSPQHSPSDALPSSEGVIADQDTPTDPRFGGGKGGESAPRRRVRFASPLLGGLEAAGPPGYEPAGKHPPQPAAQAAKVGAAPQAGRGSGLRSGSRFGPGTFVRPSTNGPATRRQTTLCILSDGSAAFSVAPLAGDDAEVVDAALQGEANPLETDVVIARRLQHKHGMAARLHAVPPPSPRGQAAAVQDLREAFLNAKLSECWRQGEAWARLDLQGVEHQEQADHEAHVQRLAAALATEAGDLQAQAALGKLSAEWQHLSMVRQRYASAATAAGAGASAAVGTPKGILKHASGVSTLREQGAPAPELQGFDAILAAEMVLECDFPSATLPAQPLTAAGMETACDLPHEQAMASVAATTEQAHALPEAVAAPVIDLTPLAHVTSRGIKMLASLQQQASTPSEARTAPCGRLSGGVNNKPRPRRLGTPSRGLKRTASRGHRLLAALQNAASNAPTAAAAAASLIVDAATGEDMDHSAARALLSAPIITVLRAD